MKKIMIMVAVALGGLSLHAQGNIDKVLAQIEANNTTLAALEQEGKAQRIGNMTGLTLPNPEVEYHYLWGSPKAIGQRNDVSVTQSFDLATITGAKRKVAVERNKMVGMQYATQRQALLADAEQLCIDLVYYNAMRQEVQKRISQASALEAAYKQRLDAGDATAMEYNKIRLSHSALQGQLAGINVEIVSLTDQLCQLNGGKPVTLSDSQYASQPLPANFDAWFEQALQHNPQMALLNQQVELSRKEVKLSKAMGLPAFSAGYMLEGGGADEKYQGITVGVSIPLWENKNRVKQAKAASLAAEMRVSEGRQQLYGSLKALYNRASAQQQVALSYQQALAELSNKQLLDKALAAGEISMLDYIVEMQLYYDTVDQTFAALRDSEKAKAQLYATQR